MMTWKTLAEKLRQYGHAVDDIEFAKVLLSAAEGLEILEALQKAGPEQNIRPAAYIKPAVDMSFKDDGASP